MAEMRTGPGPPPTMARWRTLLFGLLLLALALSATLGVRTYRSWQLLRSAEEFGAPDTASIRAWMSLDYLARTYRVPREALAERLALPANSDGRTTLRDLGRAQGRPPEELARAAQEAIAAIRAAAPTPSPPPPASGP